MRFRRLIAAFLLLGLLASGSLVMPAQAVEPIEILGTASLLVDANSNYILHEQNKDLEVPPASLTKIMTVLLVLEAIDRGELSMNQPIVASSSAISGLPEDGSTADIRAGEILTVEQLLYCVIISSANEACNILAEAVSGSVTIFISDMNKRAEELGCTHTHFTNTNGLTDSNHYMSVYDIYLVTREAMNHEEFMTLCNAKSYTIPATNMSEEREMHSTNALISNWLRTGYLYDGAIGFKTGTTDAAGYCLCAGAIRDSRTLVSVVMGCEANKDGVIESFTETSRLFDWGFENFQNQVVLEEDEMITEVPVSLSKETNYVVVHPAYTAEAILDSEINPSWLERTIELYEEEVPAPITAGQELGTITLSYNGNVYAVVPLVALNDVKAHSFLVAKKAIIHFFSQRSTHIGLIVMAVLAVLLFIYIRILRPKRRYGKKKKIKVYHNAYKGRRY